MFLGIKDQPFGFMQGNDTLWFALLRRQCYNNEEWIVERKGRGEGERKRERSRDHQQTVAGSRVADNCVVELGEVSRLGVYFVCRTS